MLSRLNFISAVAAETRALCGAVLSARICIRAWTACGTYF
jgi:hypothetical protein